MPTEHPECTTAVCALAIRKVIPEFIVQAVCRHPKAHKITDSTLLGQVPNSAHGGNIPLAEF